MVLLHAKANQIAKEILSLLQNGFADGAYARWRTLHELAVVCAFIAEHREEVAERYISHNSIEMYKAAIQYNEYYVRLGATRMEQEEIDTLKKDYDDLLV